MRSTHYKNLTVLGMSILIVVCGRDAYLARGQGQKVTLMRTPGGGIQPQAHPDSNGIIHLIYFKGDPAAGDIFYARQRNGDFSSPIRINSQAGSAIATGTVRGAHIAVGKEGRIHVAWMGSKLAEPRGPANESPMLYARLNDERSAFEPQRNVIHFATGLDGGGSVAADAFGNVYVAWHAGAGGKGEEERRIWIARSRDEGKTFAREEAANQEPTGACGCCGMRAYADAGGRVYLLYRAATAMVNRDMYLLASARGGQGFHGSRIHEWKLHACPMSTASIGAAGAGILAAWETAGQIYYGFVDPETARISTVAAVPGGASGRRHPAVASNIGGEVILAWTEGTAWNRGGSLAWQVFDRTGNPTLEKGAAPGVPVWSLVTAFARPDGGFTVVY